MQTEQTFCKPGQADFKMGQPELTAVVLDMD